jgi:hypothetical protein
MNVRFKLISLAIAAVFVSATPANAFYAGTPAYRTTYYNNPNHDVEVGHIQPWGGCSYDEVTDTDFVNYRLFGSMSAYSGPDELVGYCYYGEFVGL